jgi:positive regulator of sigma E activity
MKKNNRIDNRKEPKKVIEENDLLKKQSLQFLFQMVFIIAGPALLAAYFGKKIGIEKNMHPKLMIIFMILALIFSWSIILIKFFKFNKQIKIIDEEKKREK